jgi:hypothetical protein
MQVLSEESNQQRPVGYTYSFKRQASLASTLRIRIAEPFVFCILLLFWNSNKSATLQSARIVYFISQKQRSLTDFEPK